MKSILRKTIYREIRDSLSRYLAIAGIIALGSGFFTGLKVTTKAMIQTESLYLDETSFFDFRLVSTLGWDKDREAVFTPLEGVEKAEGSVSTDFLAVCGDSETVLHALTLTESINTPQLVSGRMPQAPNECLVDSYNLSSLSPGDIIRVSAANEEDTSDMFAYEEYTVVGKARSPLYINFERGNTTLGDGTVSGYVLLPAAGFDTDYYTEYYVRLADPGFVYTEEYDDTIDAFTDPLTDIAEAEATARYDRILSEAWDEYTDGLDKYADGRAKYVDGLRAFREGQRKYEDGVQEVMDARRELTDTFYTNRNLLLDKENELEKTRDDLTAQRPTVAAQVDTLRSAVDQARQGVAQAEAAVAAFGPTPDVTDPNYIAAATALATAQGTLSTYQCYLSQAEEGLAKIDNGLSQIASGLKTIEKNKKALYDGYYQADSEIKDAEEELVEAKKELDDAEAELIDARAELDDAAVELADAHKEISDIEAPEVYVLGRDTNVGYVCFDSDAHIVDGVAKVFPFFFFAVAALVCITTMSRMIDDERSQIGLLKALGYSERDIMARYLIYSGTASLLGCAVGVFVGCWLFPTVIWQAYLIMYSMGSIHLVFDAGLMALSGLSYLVLALAVTYFSCRNELRLAPANLIRPKAPTPGKRIWLEHIPFIWKKLKFLHKVSLRNVFRYRKRFIMMILGIGGCTALLLTGLALNDSITDIANKQFSQISVYDASVTFSEDISAQENRFLSQCGDSVTQCAFLYSGSLDCRTEAAVGSVTLCAVEDFTDLEGLMDFHVRSVPVPAPSIGECIISDNLAKRYELQVGDAVHLYSGETTEVQLRVAGIFENVIYNYVYTALESVRDVLDVPIKTAYVNLDPALEPHEAARTVAEAAKVTNVSLNCDMLQRVNNMLSSMKYVVALIIACAAALAFVVLFNLTNINIIERLREIATIKVLGFNSGETGQYVFRENLILALCGCILGVPLGIWLHNFVMNQIRIDMITFIAIRKPISYILAVALTFVFTWVVNLVMKPRLDKINTAEALKSVE